MLRLDFFFFFFSIIIVFFFFKQKTAYEIYQCDWSSDVCSSDLKKINPAVTIIDGILAMEGEGPGKRGRPRSLDVIMGSSDPVSLDIAVCRMIGLDPLSLLTNKVAVDRGLPINDPPVDGKIPEVKNFELPTVGPVIFGPRMLHGFMRRHLIEKPAQIGRAHV